MRWWLAGLAAMAALGVEATPQNVFAQDISALRRHDTDATIDVDADRFEVRDRENIAVFQGNVKVNQANLTLEANTVRVYYDRAQNNDLAILRIDANGNVQLTSPSERALGNYGIYDVKQRQITLVGNVRLIKGESTLNGDRLQVNLDSGVIRLNGAPTQAGQSSGRVTGRFVVPPREDQR
ncbi:LptA/OstA family protein [Pedomonas mirosovicensis]|uniref:LptA/OstA family protein n=1 Tax=Pedomonas mirosovicensis TaxID=2908641 RepID=UPI0021682E45|nr:LptA/OstA family protein [Pedomonas mirosovicensis]MCH8684055.1 OstA family protein [Pedomonas mirosovicensis]